MNDVKHLKVKQTVSIGQIFSGAGFISTLAFILFVLPMLLPFARLP